MVWERQIFSYFQFSICLTRPPIQEEQTLEWALIKKDAIYVSSSIESYSFFWLTEFHLCTEEM